MKYLFPIFFSLLFLSCNEESNNKTTKSNTPHSNMKEQHIFVGTYTKKEGHVDGKGAGIYRLTFFEKGDSIHFDTTKTKSFKTINPSYITISPNQKYLYAVNELNPNDGDSGTVEAYEINDQTHDIKLINQQKTNNYAPCHVTVDQTNKMAFVANYVGGIVVSYPILDNGGLDSASTVIELKGKGITDRQESSHPHSTFISPDNKFVFIADLGTDKITRYAINHQDKSIDTASKTELMVQAGAGPRHFAFHPNGKIGYVVNELDATVNTFGYNPEDGQLKEIQSISTLPDGFDDFSLCADIHVHPSGKFVYASNRGHNSIAIFQVNEESGMLTFHKTVDTKGDFPRNFAIDPAGKFLWVANQNSDSIFVFKINTTTGDLNEVGNVRVPTPVCLKFL